MPWMRVSVVLLLSQIAYYGAAYLLLRVPTGLYRYMLLVTPLLALGAWGPFWALRFAAARGWNLWPVQLSQFAFAVVASALGLIVLGRQLPTSRSLIGMTLVIAGVVVSGWQPR